MRADDKLAANVRNSKGWKSDAVSGQPSQHVDSRRMGMGLRADGKLYTYSLSGSERNHLFMSQRGATFSDVSLLSGLDVVTDSRAFALLDYDRDGWQDIALANANSPLLNLFHNEIVESEDGDPNRCIALRFVGGNNTSAPSSFSSRDGYGVIAKIATKDVTIVREHHCGEGLAARNSSTMLVGIGKLDQADSIEVRWPSGHVQKSGVIRAGTLVTVHERPSMQNSGFESEPYHGTVSDLSARIEATHLQRTGLSVAFGDAQTDDAAHLRMYTTMATWCPACKKLLPQLKRVRAHFLPEELVMLGIPADPKDSRAQLKQYVAQHRPSYQLLDKFGRDNLLHVSRVLNSTLPSVALPSTFITDRDGNVLRSYRGIPTISEVGKLLLQVKNGNS